MVLRITLLIICVLTCNQFSVAQNIKAKAGVLDARGWDPQRKLALNGEWAYFPNTLRSGPADNSTFVEFPHMWNNGQGYATYRLQVLLPRDNSKIAISLPQIYSAYSFIANGQEVATNGKIGANKGSTVPQWRPQTVTLPDVRDTLELVLTIANFQHYVGGIREPIFIGEAEKMLSEFSQSRLFELIEFGALTLIGFGFLIMFLIGERKKVIVYFALFCFSWAIRSMFSNQYVFIHYFPSFNWWAMIRIEYIMLYLTMIWAMLFLGRLFVRDVNAILKYLLVGGNVLFVAITLLAAPVLFTSLLNVYLTFAALILLYGVVVVLIALINGRPGSLALTISTVLGAGVFVYDILSYKGFFMFNQAVFSVGYILIFLFMGLALLYFLNILKSKLGQSDKLTYEDFFGKN